MELFYYVYAVRKVRAQIFGAHEAAEDEAARDAVRPREESLTYTLL